MLMVANRARDGAVSREATRGSSMSAGARARSTLAIQPRLHRV